MEESRIVATIKNIVQKKLKSKEEDLTLEADFIEDLGADSLETTELIMSFEESFNIQIPDEDAEKIQSIGSALEYIKKAIS